MAWDEVPFDDPEKLLLIAMCTTVLNELDILDVVTEALEAREPKREKPVYDDVHAKAADEAFNTDGAKTGRFSCETPNESNTGPRSHSGHVQRWRRGSPLVK